MRLIPILLLLCACHAPGPHFRNVPAVRVTVSGSTFDVRVRDKLGEAIRTNAQYAPRLGPIADRAKTAIELASGCRVQRLKGDQAQIIGELDCGDGAARTEVVSAIYRDFECLQTAEFRRPSTGEIVRELDCTPIR